MASSLSVSAQNVRVPDSAVKTPATDVVVNTICVFRSVHRRVRHNDLIKINGVGVFQRIVPHVR